MTGSSWTNARAADALVACFEHAVAAVDPGDALRRILHPLPPPSRAVHLLATGKAAAGMYRAAADWLTAAGRPPLQGLVVTTEGMAAACADLPMVIGDHPIPGPRSERAADAVAAFAAGVRPDDEVWLLLSGGTSSLIAGPVDGVSMADLTTLFRQVGAAGFDIHQANAIRKRFARWGAGRLAMAVDPAPCRTFALSDVPGDVPGSIGSGPTVGDTTVVDDIVMLLAQSGGTVVPPPTVQANIAGVESGTVPETPKPELSLFRTGVFHLVATNATAQEAAAEHGRRQGWTVHRPDEPVEGPAAPAGRRLGREVAAAARRGLDGPQLFVWGGESTVSLPEGHSAPGGRCQELALAAAAELAPLKGVAAFLAAGTDGRDGPTDAAGAVVTPDTWTAIEASGLDPETALTGHASYRGLAAADALLRVGETGTNVADLVLALVVPGNQGASVAGGW